MPGVPARALDLTSYKKDFPGIITCTQSKEQGTSHSNIHNSRTADILFQKQSHTHRTAQVHVIIVRERGTD